MTTPLASNSQEPTDPSISFRKAGYVAAMAAGIGCIGPVGFLGYVGAAAAGALAGVAIDAAGYLGQRLISPYYSNLTHHLAGPFCFDQCMEKYPDPFEKAFARLQSHTAFLSLKANNQINGTFSAKRFIKLFGNRKRGEGEITALLNLINQNPDLSWDELLRSIKVEEVFYYQMLHILKFKIDFAKATLIIMNAATMYGPGSSDITRQIEAREKEIQQLSLLSPQLASELYPYQVINGEPFTRSLKYSFEQLLAKQPEQGTTMGRLILLSPNEALADERYYYLQRSRLLWIHDGFIPEKCSDLPVFRDSASAFTGRSVFFQYGEGVFRLYDPIDGFFEFDAENDFFDTLLAIKGNQTAQFSIYLPKQTENS